MPYYTQDELLAETRDRETHWMSRLQVWADIDALNRGDWGAVFRTKRGNPEMSAGELFTGNLFRRTIEDGGYLFAEATPSERVDKAEDSDKRSETREQAIAAYNNISNLYDYSEQFGQDLIAAGLTGIKTWPNFSKPPSERFPHHYHVNPRTLLLPVDWANDRQTDDIIHNYVKPTFEVAKQFGPEVAELAENYVAKKGRGTTSLPGEVRVVDYMSTDYIRRVCYVRERNEDIAAVTLMETVNDTGICPIQVAARVNWSSGPMGTLDDTRGVARLRNRYWRILLDHWVSMVYGPTLVYNVKNPRKTDDIWLALSQDAYAKRVGSENVSWQVDQILDRLEKEERTGKVAPLSREGEVDLNKATRAFLQEAQGQLKSMVRSNLRQFANMKRRSNEAAMAQDEKWCAANKKVTGKARGRRFAITYNPKTFKGDYSNRVSYDSFAGSSQAEQQVLGLQKVGKGMSWETFMEKDPDIEDVPLEQAKLIRERLREALILRAESEQDIRTQFALVEVINDMVSGRDWDVTIAKLKEILAPPAPPPVPQPELGAGEMEALPATGMPGIAPEAAPPEQPVVLPSREELRRMVIVR